MEDITTQTRWMQLINRLCCGDCKAVRLMIWQRQKQVDAPNQAINEGEYWYAIHCDYFKRRIEHPDKLLRCGAHQIKSESSGE